MNISRLSLIDKPQHHNAPYYYRYAFVQVCTKTKTLYGKKKACTTKEPDQQGGKKNSRPKGLPKAEVNQSRFPKILHWWYRNGLLKLSIPVKPNVAPIHSQNTAVASRSSVVREAGFGTELLPPATAVRFPDIKRQANAFLVRTRTTFREYYSVFPLENKSRMDCVQRDEPARVARSHLSLMFWERSCENAYVCHDLLNVLSHKLKDIC